MLTIRPLEPDDRDRLFAWRTRDDVSRWMYSQRRISEDEHDIWFTEVLTDPRRHYWVIVLHGRPVGIVHLSEHDGRRGEADWGMYLGEESARGMGAAGAAIVLSLDAGFGRLALELVRCEALAHNERAVRLYERAAFRRVATLPARVRRGDKVLDVVRFEMDKNRWSEHRDSVARPLVTRGLL